MKQFSISVIMLCISFPIVSLVEAADDNLAKDMAILEDLFNKIPHKDSIRTGPLVVSVNSNTSQSLQSEISSERFQKILCHIAALDLSEVRKLQVTVETTPILYCDFVYCPSEEASKTVWNYLLSRVSGHSQEYAMCAMEESNKPAPADPVFQAIRAREKLRGNLFPISWLQNHLTRQDEASTCGQFVITDGDISTSYDLEVNSNGLLYCGHDARIDSKEFDPRYRKIIKRVEGEIEEIMRKDGSDAVAGSWFRFEILKQEALRREGIEWRSPTQLNPGVFY